MRPLSAADLRPGDLLFYDRNGLVNLLIRSKTWSEVSHVETYIGGGEVIASRNPRSLWRALLHVRQAGCGVGRYPLALDGLVAVRRPIPPFNLEAALAWHATVEGQAYDLRGLLRFFKLGAESLDRQFCSEHAMRVARHAGVEPFAAETDADLIDPGRLFITAVYLTVYLVTRPRRHRWWRRALFWR